MGERAERRAMRTATAGIVLGAGLSALLDGIVLHQILQWHHLLTSAPDPAVARDPAFNTLADGLFHLAAYALAIAGIVLLWQAWRRPDAVQDGRVLLGSILLGAGLFDVAEGVVNHHLVGIHHVHPSGSLAWDLAFLVFGSVLALAGWLLLRRASEARRQQPLRRSLAKP